MKELHFLKMHGLGNDFVILDMRMVAFSMSDAFIKRVAQRRRGVGCDQFVIIEQSDKADCFVRFFNPDGSESGACGNATRCVAYLIMDEQDKESIKVETSRGILECKWVDNKIVSVNMGRAEFDWDKIPLAREIDTLHLKIGEGELFDPVAVNVGNPHAVFFVNDIKKIPLEAVGPILENHSLFPARANIGIAQILNKETMYLRVWERGAGETMACGSGACAAMVAAFRRQLTKNIGIVKLPGGDLKIEILEDGDVIMTGEVSSVFKGVFDESFL